MHRFLLATMFTIAAMLLSASGVAQADLPTNDIECVGFDYPLDDVFTIRVRENRYALPLRARLYTLDDASGTKVIVTDDDLGDYPPVVEVDYYFDPNVDPDTVTLEDWEEDAVSISDANDGIKFEYYPLSQEWKFNLMATTYDAVGLYKVTMEAGGDYMISEEDKCSVIFYRLEDYNKPR